MSLVGRQIGRYRILEQLGQGGMSVVYKGLDTALEREVAVKVLHPHLAEKEESRKRLAREARAVAKLHHPNILEVFDYAGSDSSDAFIVTEYIRGQTLRQFAADQAFSPPEIAAMVVHELASALAHAHEANVIHRDLKPENVMVRDDGVLKLMDFGIAKIIDREEKMTMTGALVGSPAHMAPEIIEGVEAGPEADVFSLGTILYLLTTGQLPFTASNTTATLKRILDGVYEDPRQKAPAVSDELSEIISTCLQRQRANRYPTATRLRDALESYLASLGVDRISEELAAFFADPPSYRQRFTKRLATALVERGERLLAEKRPARALSCLNQVLALEPDNARALRLLDQMNRARQRQRRLASAIKYGAVAALLAATGSAGLWAYRGANAVADFYPPVRRGSQVLLAASVYPPVPAPPPAPAVSPPQVQPAQFSPAPMVPPAVAHQGIRPPVETEIVVNVRPWGSVRVDGELRSSTELPRHVLKLLPGKHRLTVGCERFCTETGSSREIHVAVGNSETVNIPAPLRPSSVSFFGFPPEAIVHLDGEVRSVRESQERPFAVSMPPEGSTQMGHKVSYEITAPGFRPFSSTTWIKPGAAEEIRGSLSPE